MKTTTQKTKNIIIAFFSVCALITLLSTPAHARYSTQTLNKIFANQKSPSEKIKKATQDIYKIYHKPTRLYRFESQLHRNAEACGEYYETFTQAFEDGWGGRGRIPIEVYDEERDAHLECRYIEEDDYDTLSATYNDCVQISCEEDIQSVELANGSCQWTTEFLGESCRNPVSLIHEQTKRYRAGSQNSPLVRAGYNTANQQAHICIQVDDRNAEAQLGRLDIMSDGCYQAADELE